MQRRGGRRLTRLRVTTAAVLVIVALAAWAVVAGLLARGDLLEVRAAAQQLQEHAPDDVAELRAVVDPAAEAARRARRRLSQPGPALVARIPVLGRSLAAERDLAIAADVLLDAASSLLADAERLQVDGGSLDVQLLRAMARDLDRAGRDLAGPMSRLAATPLTWVPGSVREAVEQAREQLDGADARLRTAGGAAEVLARLLGADGRRTVVVVLMNNAELRGAGGYGGSFAVLQADAGEVSVGPFQDVNDVQQPPEQARTVPAPPDYAARWGPYLANSTLWKNTLMSADQPTSAAVTCAVARLAPGVPCDAVVLLDVPALARLVELTGPVDLGAGPPVAGDELVRALLVEAYAETGATADEQDERRRRLRRAADDAVSGLLGSRLTAVEALRTLVDAVRGRHLAVWSAHAPEQAALRAAGLAGGVDPQGADLNLVAINQLSAGKLDYYVTRSVGQLAVVGEQEAEVTQKVTLTLQAPPDLPPYVLGVRDGRLEEVMDIAVSPAATDVVVRRDGRELPVALLEEDGSRRVAVEVVLTAGASTTWEVSYRVPLDGGRYRLRLLPQPLARDAVLHLAVVAREGRRLQGGDVTYDGPYDRSRTVDVQLER